MQHPKVSVIVPNYNHAPFLVGRIESILGQTYNDLELLILDDASTDDSHRILTQYYGNPRVRILVNSTNSGSAFHQWNRGISLVSGEYIWIAESDDVADPRLLEVLVPLLDDNPSLGLAYCRSHIIDKAGVRLGDSLGWTSDLDPHRWEADFANNGKDELRNYLIRKNTIPNASAVITRRSVVNKVLPVDPSFQLCGDWMHWGKVLLHTNLAYIAEPLNLWRLGSSHSRVAHPGVLEWEEGQRIIRHLANQVGYAQSQTSELLAEFADRCQSWAAAASGP